MSETCGTCGLPFLDDEEHSYYAATTRYQAGEHHLTEYTCIARLRAELADAKTAGYGPSVDYLSG